MNITRKIIVGLALSALLALSPAAYAVDIYLVYAGSDKPIQKELKAALSSNFQVKSYNVDMLAMADYSGKQKAISKIAKAKLVVLVNNKPEEALEGAEFSNVISVDSADDVGAITEKLN